MRPFAGAQRLQQRMRDVEDAVEIDRHDVLPVLQHRIGIRGEGIAAVDAGIVDQDRDLTDLARDLLGDREAILALRHVERETLGFTAGTADLAGRVACGLGVDVEQHDARALTREAGRDRAADAGGGAGDDGDVILEKGHGVSSAFDFCGG